MEKAYLLGREETMPNSYARIVRRSVVLCAAAIPVVGFNIFASSQHNEAILSWSLAITVTFALLGSAFVLWAANILWPPRADRAAAVAK
jgi:hypothetical protein